MTKAEAIKTVKIVAKANGFKVEESKYATMGIRIKAKNVNFFIKDNVKLTLGEGKVTHTFEFKASVSRMGGEDTTDGLLAIAREIEKAATTIETLNLMGISYEEFLGCE